MAWSSSAVVDSKQIELVAKNALLEQRMAELERKVKELGGEI